MFKIIIGLLAGSILSGALFMGPLSPITAVAQSGNTSLMEASVNITEIYHEALTSPLQKAGQEIQDKDTAQFFQKLLREYELDETSSGVLPEEHSSLVEVLPDIKKINHAALTLPLREAGKNIQDKEIAQFYYKLLGDAGWTIESD